MFKVLIDESVNAGYRLMFDQISPYAVLEEVNYFLLTSGFIWLGILLPL